MPSKTKPLTDVELEAYEAERDLAAELLQSVREMKAGQGHVVCSAAIEARKRPASRSPSSRRYWAYRFARCRGGSKAASSPAARRERCSLLRAPIPRRCWMWREVARGHRGGMTPIERISIGMPLSAAHVERHCAKRSG